MPSIFARNDGKRKFSNNPAVELEVNWSAMKHPIDFIIDKKKASPITERNFQLQLDQHAIVNRLSKMGPH